MGRKRRDGEIGGDMLLVGVGLFPDGPKVTRFSVKEVRSWEEHHVLHKSLGAASRREGDPSSRSQKWTSCVAPTIYISVMFETIPVRGLGLKFYV